MYGYIIPTTKVQKHAAKAKKHELYRSKYYRCVATQKKKGKPAYPNGGSRCKVYYNKMKKYELQREEKAEVLRAKLERKEKLAPELERVLSASGKVPGATAATATASFRPSDTPELMLDDTFSEDLESDQSSFSPLIIAGGIAAALAAGAFFLSR